MLVLTPDNPLWMLDPYVDMLQCVDQIALFNPVTKSKVTSEGETVMTLLLDVIAAKGYEKNTYFHQANRFIGWLPRLEGTVHVNVGQILKFMPNYLFEPVEYPEIGTRLDASDDTFFFAQGPVGGAGKVRFADWTTPYAARTDVPNVAVFYEQAQALQALLQTAAPSAEQQKDLDFLLTIGHLFSLIVYGQLILEQAELLGRRQRRAVPEQVDLAGHRDDREGDERRRAGDDRREERVEDVDVIFWNTGFRSAIDHLATLRLRAPGGGITMSGRLATVVDADPRIQLLGYGPSASTIRANRAGREAARVAAELLGVPSRSRGGTK